MPFAFHATQSPGTSGYKHYYVSATGSDANDGLTTDTPFLTLNKVSTTNLVPGDTVSFKGGETIIGNLNKTDTNIFTSGSYKIVFNSYGTGKATLRPTNNTIDKLFQLYYTNQIKYEFKSLIFNGYYNAETGADSLNQNGLWIASTTYFSPSSTGSNMHIVVDSCEFTGFESNGLVILNKSSLRTGYFRVTNNDFHDLGLYGYQGEGMYNCDFRISNNSFTNIHGKINNTTVGDYAMGFRQIFARDFIVERNYVNNIGKYSSGGAGLYVSAAAKVKFQHNEVRNVYGPTSIEGYGLYADCDCDSITFEYNYIQNCRGGIQIASGHFSGCSPPLTDGLTIDSTGTRGSIARYNIIVSDTNSLGAFITYQTSSNPLNYASNNFIYNNLIYLKGSYKNLDTAAGRTITAGIWQFGYQESLYVYNNIFYLDSARAFSTPTIAKTGYGVAKDYIVKNNLYYTTAGDSSFINAYYNGYWTNTTAFHWYNLTFPSMLAWADSTNFEKHSGSYTYVRGDPKIKNILARTYGNTAEINPYSLDTLNDFKAEMYSNGYQAGVNYNSRIKLLGDTATVDFYGAAIKYPNPDIGINSIPTPTGSGGDTTNFYVDNTNGDDTYDGHTQAQPFKTLSKASTIVYEPGDTIFLKGGETFIGGFKTKLTYNDTTNAFVITRYGTTKPLITLGPADSMAINIEYTQHVKIAIDSIKIQGSYNSTTQSGGTNLSRGIYIWNATLISPLASNKISQLFVNNCEIRDIKTQGINVTLNDYGQTLNCKIDSNLIYDLGGTAIVVSYNWHSGSRVFGNTIYNIKGFTGIAYSYGIDVMLCKDVTIEKNLIYNIGQNTSTSGLGIITGTSKNIKIKNNEIYGILSNSTSDAEAIGLENGSDSCLVENNYIHDTPGMGILISANSSEGSINSNYRTYAANRGSIDSGSSDYNVVRYNLLKNLSNTNIAGYAGIKAAMGGVKPSIPGKNNEIYNNTIIYTKRILAGAYGVSLSNRSDSTKIFNNITIGDSLIAFILDTLSTKTNAYVDNNLYWDRTPGWASFIITPTTYTTITSWAAATGWESKLYKYNPLLTDGYSLTGDTLNNPYNITTLSKYLPVEGSITTNLGKTFSTYTISTPTTDLRGRSITGNVGIGAFTDTVSYTYTFQPETKRLLARDTALITLEDRYIKDSLILGLKTDTLFTKIDAAYVLASANEYSAKLNIIKDTSNATMVGGITFTAYEGFKNNGNGGLYGNLNTNFTPSTQGINYALNYSGFGVYSRTDTLSGNTESYEIMTTSSSPNTYSAMRLRYLDVSTEKMSNWINDYSFSNLSYTGGGSSGLFTINRIAAGGAGSVKIYKNGVYLNTNNSSSTALSTATYKIFSYGTASSNTSHRQLSFAYFGSALTADQNFNLTNNIERYLDRYGKGVIVPQIAATYYVDSLSGNDNNIGTTIGTAWQTLAKVRSHTFMYGDTIKFKAPYTYTGYIYKKDSIGTAQLSNINFDSYGTGKATILADSNNQAFKFISRLDNPFRVSIRNLKITGTYSMTTEHGHHWYNAIDISAPDSMLVDSTGYLKVTNCEITKFGLNGIAWLINDVRRNYKVNIDSNLVYNCGVGGIQGSAVWKTSTIIGNTVYNIDGHKNWTGGTPDTTGFVLPIFISYSKNFTISRNLVYNNGIKAKYGTANIAASGSRNINISYNETYGSKSNTVDGDGIDLDWGTDSSVVEYNYVHNNGAAGVLISGSDTNWRPYNTIYFGEGSYLKDSTGSDYNIVRYNVFKNNNRSLAYGDVTLYNDDGRMSLKGNKIYNNTFSQAKKSGITNASFINFKNGTDSTRIFNNVFLGDSILFLKSDVNNSSHVSMTVKNNMYWDSLRTYKNVYWQGGVITLASWFSTYAYESSGSTALQYNPFLNNPWAVKDTINNPYKIDTLSAYKKIYGPSVITDFGINFDSTYAYTLTNYTLGTNDFYGSTLKINNKYDLGAYEDTASYKWQDTTKLWTGDITKHFNTDTLVYYDSLILRLQQDSIMRNTRLLYMFYSPDTALAYRSLKLEDTLATKSGGLTFTSYGGITTDSLNNGVLNTNMKATSTDGIYTNANGGIGILITNNSNAAGTDVGAYSGGEYWWLSSKHYGNLTTIYFNSANLFAFANPDSTSKGFYFTQKRTESNDTTLLYKNGIKTTGVVRSLDTIPNYFIVIGGIRYGGTSVSQASIPPSRNYASFWSGAGLSDYRQAKLNEHLQWFMARIGKPIQTQALRDASAIKASTGGYIMMGYTPVSNYNNDTLKLYYYRTSDSKYIMARSTNGITFTDKDTITGGPATPETILKLNGSSTDYRMLKHVGFGGEIYHQVVYRSSNGGKTFSNTDTNTIFIGSSNVTGEDHGMVYNPDSNKYNIYLRPIGPKDLSGSGFGEWGPFRKISLIKTSDFLTFSSSYKPQLPVDTNQYYRSTSKDYHKAFYSMSVVKTASDEWWGFVNVLKVDDSTRDVYDQGNPGGGWEKATDNTIEIQLVYSKDGENWIRCNDTLAVIPLYGTIKQIFGTPTIVGNEIWIYTMNTNTRHVSYQPAGTWDLWRYRISIGELRKFKK